MSKRKTTKEFVSQSELVHQNKYDYSKTEYINNKQKVKIFCKKHRCFFNQLPNDHLRGRTGCPECIKEKLSEANSSDKNIFIEKANKKYNYKYDYSYVDYKNDKTNIKIICPIHGMFEQTPKAHLYSKYGCPLCGDEQKINSEEEIINSLPNKEFFENIQKVSTHSADWLITRICPKCGNKLTKTIHYFKYDFKLCDCEKPNDYLGEARIADWLSKNNIRFERRYHFPGLKDQKSLNYDFYLPDLKVLIEHQGEQHYKPKNFGGISSEVAEKNFILQQRHDELKREFAKDNGFSLLEISYKDFENIEKILKDFFLTKKEKFDIINHKVERV